MENNTMKTERTKQSTPAIKVSIRWMIRSDMPEVLRIEGECFREPWTEERFLDELRKRNCIGMVAEFGGKIVGYNVYDLEKTSIEIINFAVDPAFHSLGVGRQMVDRLKYKLPQQRRSRIELKVAESNLDAQLFFQAQEFFAVDVIRDHFTNGESAYVMDFRHLDTGGSEGVEWGEGDILEKAE